MGAWPRTSRATSSLCCALWLPSSYHVLPPPKVLVAELYPCLLGERPPWLCSWQPEDTLLDLRPCTAEPMRAHGGRIRLSLLTTRLHLPKVRISPPMHLPATPELYSAENTKRHQCLLNNHLLSWKDQARPAKNMLKEVRAHHLQLGLDKDNNGAFHWESMWLIYMLRREVLCSTFSSRGG